MERDELAHHDYPEPTTVGNFTANMAEYVAVKARNLAPLPGDLDSVEIFPGQVR